jgi:hypothetical protein
MWLMDLNFLVWFVLDVKGPESVVGPFFFEDETAVVPDVGVFFIQVDAPAVVAHEAS